MIFLTLILADLINHSSQKASIRPKSEQIIQFLPLNKQLFTYDVQVNHIYFVVDREIYEVIKSSDLEGTNTERSAVIFPSPQSISKMDSLPVRL